MAQFVLLAAVMVGSGACGGGGSGSSGSSAEQADHSSAPDQGGDAPQGKASGWRWKGQHQDCFFIFHNRCFAKQAAACRAAGCKEADCDIDGSAPAKVSCRK